MGNLQLVLFFLSFHGEMEESLSTRVISYFDIARKDSYKPLSVATNEKVTTLSRLGERKRKVATVASIEF